MNFHCAWQVAFLLGQREFGSGTAQYHPFVSRVAPNGPENRGAYAEEETEMTTDELIAEEFIRAGTAAFWTDEWCARLVAHPLRQLIVFIMERQSGFDMSSDYDGGCVQ